MDTPQPAPGPSPQPPYTSPPGPYPPGGAPPDASLTGDVRPEPLPDGLWSRMRADPQQAPEYLAVAAVEKLGPEAARRVAKFHQKYPGATPDGMAHLAKLEAVRMSRYSGAVAGTAGAVGAVLDVGVVAWNQARMVLYLAAIYGQDPTDPQRGAELLVLRGIHTKLAAARTALDVAAKRTHASALLDHVPKRESGMSVLAWELAKMAGMAAGKKMAMKFVPFAAVPLGAMANASSTKKLADKAIRLYVHMGPRALPPGR